MCTWTPPPGTKVVFGIGAVKGPYGSSICPPDGITVEDFERREQELCARLGLKHKKHGFYEVRLDDSRWPALLDAFESLAAENVMCLDACWLEEPPPKQSDPSAWFELSPGPTKFRSPAKVAQGAHLGWRDGQQVASEMFLDAVRAAGLTGLASIPLEDSRPDDPMRWFEIYAEHPIGRGLDHPMVDPAKHEAELAKNKLEPARRWGEPIAWLPKFRDDVTIGDLVLTRLMRLTPHKFFRIAGPHRFVREHLPQSDFAYKQWGFRPDTGPGYEGRPIRAICCNARARKALIDAGVMKPARFEPLATIPASEANAEILDRTVPHPIPLPVYTSEEAAAERTRREKILAKAAANPAPPRLAFATIDDAVAYLQRRIDDGTATWFPLAKEEKFEEFRAAELFARAPEAWRRVLPLLPAAASAPLIDGNDDVDDEMFDFMIAPPEWNDWLADDPGDAPPDEQPSSDDLVIARTPYGDWYAVRMNDSLLPADGRVVHWDHETTAIKQEWPSIAAFVAEIIEACDRGGVERADEWFK